MFMHYFQITGLSVLQIFILGAMGYFLIKRNILGDSALDGISRLVIEVTLPIMIFCQLIKEFSFSTYANWWFFPLLSIAITLLGLVLGFIFSFFIHGRQHKVQFLSLITFQNSGYLPLALVAALLPADKANVMFIYLFLFLLGFNLVMLSFGVYLLTFTQNKKFELGAIFNPPVVAALFSLVFIFLGLTKFVPDFIFRPLKAIGDCTLPLAMVVVGGNLAAIHLGHIDKKAMSLMILVKLIIMPLLGLFFIMKLSLPELIGLLIIIELAVPAATLLSVVTRHYKKEDLLISQGIFIGHLVSIVSIPLFLSLFFFFTAPK
jgi:predicted permease